MKRLVFAAAVVIMVLFLMSACSQNEEVTELTFWHAYSFQADSHMNELVKEFNNTVGKEKNIYINVTHISGLGDMHLSLTAAANDDPHYASMPDIFVCYPYTVESIGTDNFVNWDEYFTEDELSEFVPEFLNYGTVDGKLLCFPLGTATNITVVNSAAFDQFSKDTGCTYEMLSTWEGVNECAESYGTWIAMLPEDDYRTIANFLCTSVSDECLLSGAASLGDPSVLLGGIDINTPEFREIFALLSAAEISGSASNIMNSQALASRKNQVDRAFALGYTVMGIIPSSRLPYLEYFDHATYPDNTQAKLDYTVLSLPTMENGNSTNFLYGLGLCAVKSNSEKDTAAAIFCKWLTENDNNTSLAVEFGLLPVREGALEQLLYGDRSFISSKLLQEFYDVVESTYSKTNYLTSRHSVAALDASSKLLAAFEATIENHLKENELSNEDIAAAIYADFAAAYTDK